MSNPEVNRTVGHRKRKIKYETLLRRHKALKGEFDRVHADAENRIATAHAGQAAAEERLAKLIGEAPGLLVLDEIKTHGFWGRLRWALGFAWRGKVL